MNMNMLDILYSKSNVYFEFTAATLTLLFSAFIGYLVFCWKFFSIDLAKCMLAFMSASAIFGCIYMMIIAITMMRHKVVAIFEDLSTIYNANENVDSFRFLALANDLCEWMGSIYLKYIICNVVGIIMTCFISVVYCWLMNEHFNVKDCFHTVPIVLPWNQTTVLGYSGEVVLINAFGASYLIVTGVFLLQFISMCLHHHAIYKIFKHSIDKLNRSDDKNGCDEKFLCDLIRFQTLVKDWFLDSAQIYSPIVMVQIICSVIMAVSIFYLDLRFQHFDFDVATAVASFSVGIVNALLYCYFGKMASVSYEKMHDCLFDLKWYERPIATQKYFILMAANMQRPLHYHGFGVLYLNLETFTQLLRSVFSYYTAIKTFTTK